MHMNTPFRYRPGGGVRPPAFWFVLCLLLWTGCADEGAHETGGGRTAAGIYGSDPIENGRISYVTYCASCHGADGRGDGPVAAALVSPATDLTRISERAGGAYPVDSVYAYIDGREDVAAHGTRDMPVWGNIWIEEHGEPVQQEAVAHRINELVEYLRTIQAAPDSTLQ